ncbi:MAG: prepilin-type N-terminal cleavage/methylation domain-containing protein [Defluviitaleaceae bacterium]|nr:prepilin-type N-terminal cleavage/methylation domain-containing protein [Defluviitaleaceae bacterium]
MQKKKCSGFTLLELLIALAILAVIAAILIPNFFATTDRARLRSDIQSARVIQNAIELYRAERGSTPEGTGMEAVLETLTTAGFLRARYGDIQTEGAAWENHSELGVVVNISGSGDSVHSAYASLPEGERMLVVGGTGGS